MIMMMMMIMLMMMMMIIIMVMVIMMMMMMMMMMIISLTLLNTLIENQLRGSAVRNLVCLALVNSPRTLIDVKTVLW